MQAVGPASDVRWYWANYAGRPTLLYKATKQTEDLRKTCAPGMGAQIWYKREAHPPRGDEPSSSQHSVPLASSSPPVLLSFPPPSSSACGDSVTVLLQPFFRARKVVTKTRTPP